MNHHVCNPVVCKLTLYHHVCDKPCSEWCVLPGISSSLCSQLSGCIIPLNVPDHPLCISMGSKVPSAQVVMIEGLILLACIHKDESFGCLSCCFAKVMQAHMDKWPLTVERWTPSPPENCLHQLGNRSVPVFKLLLYTKQLLLCTEMTSCVWALVKIPWKSRETLLSCASFLRVSRC